MLCNSLKCEFELTDGSQIHPSQHENMDVATSVCYRFHISGTDLEQIHLLKGPSTATHGDYNIPWDKHGVQLTWGFNIRKHSQTMPWKPLGTMCMHGFGL